MKSTPAVGKSVNNCYCPCITSSNSDIFHFHSRTSFRIPTKVNERATIKPSWKVCFLELDSRRGQTLALSRRVLTGIILECTASFKRHVGVLRVALQYLVEHLVTGWLTYNGSLYVIFLFVRTVSRFQYSHQYCSSIRSSNMSRLYFISP